jgi:hypothetical protein
MITDGLLGFLKLHVTDLDCLLVLFTDRPYQQHPQNAYQLSCCVIHMTFLPCRGLVPGVSRYKSTRPSTSSTSKPGGFSTQPLAYDYSVLVVSSEKFSVRGEPSVSDRG